jgi:hypothetical protein
MVWDEATKIRAFNAAQLALVMFHRAIHEVDTDEDTAREFSLEVVSNVIEESPDSLDSKDGISHIAQIMNPSRYIERG